MNHKLKHTASISIMTPVDQVWLALTDKELVKECFWGSEVSSDWKKGSPINYSGVWEEVPYTDKGIILEIEKNKILKHTYWSSFWKEKDDASQYCSISYNLLNENDKTVLRVTQEGFRDEAHYQSTKNMWDETLENVKKVLEKKNLLERTNQTFETLEASLTKLSQQQIDAIPKVNSWSVGQVAEHLIIAHTGLKDFFTASNDKTKRVVDEKITELKDLFLNLSVKMQSPDFLHPDYASYDKKSIVERLDAIKKELLEIIQTFDWNSTCKLMALPTFGYLTRLEWINFTLFHIQRHTAQIKEITQMLEQR